MINFLSLYANSAPEANDVTRFPEGDRGPDKYFGAVLTNHPLDTNGNGDYGIWTVAPMVAGRLDQPGGHAELLGPGEVDILFEDSSAVYWTSHGMVINKSGKNNVAPTYSSPDLDILATIDNVRDSLLNETWWGSCFGKIKMFLLSDKDYETIIPPIHSDYPILEVGSNLSLSYPDKSDSLLLHLKVSDLALLSDNTEKLYFGFNYDEFMGSNYTENDPCLATMLAGLYQNTQYILTMPDKFIHTNIMDDYTPILKIGFDKIPDPTDTALNVYAPYIGISDEAIEHGIPAINLISLLKDISDPLDLYFTIMITS